MLGYLRDRPQSTPRVTRVFALLCAAMADAGVAAWDAKYSYWSPRPENAIRELGLDAPGEILAHLFPDDARLFRAKAREAAVSRLYGGIHWPSDNKVGLRLGRKIRRLFVARAERDGAKR